MSGHGFHPFGGHVSRRFRDSQLSPDDAYLSYYDVRLTKDDYDCMKSDWLTDNAIAFHEEYLERSILPSYPQSHITLLRPSMTFLLNQTPDPLTLKSALPDFSASTHIFLPINDNHSPSTAEGGTHWSLLLVSIIDGVGFHYDSLRPSNYSFGRMACDKLAYLLGRPLRFIEMEGSPQQENGSDCGVFVVMSMRYLLERKLLTRDTRGLVSMGVGKGHVDAREGRREMVRLVERMRERGERSRSRSRTPGGRGSPPRVGD